MNVSQVELAVAEQGALFDSYETTIAEPELMTAFLTNVDYRLRPFDARLVLSAGGIGSPDSYPQTVNGQHAYKDVCAEQGVIPYSAITIDQSTDSIPKITIDNMGVDHRRDWFPGRNIAVAGSISKGDGFQQITYLPPQGSTIDYGAHLRDMMEGGYALTDADLVFRTASNDQSSASVTGAMRITKIDDVYHLSLSLGEKLSEGKRKDLTTLLHGLEQAKLGGTADLGKLLFESHKAELRELGAQPIGNVRDSEYLGQLVLATLLFSKPDSGLRVEPGSYEFGGPRKISERGYSVWAETDGYVGARGLYEAVNRNDLVSSLSSALHMSWVGPEIIFRDFGENLERDGVTDVQDIERYKATIARWAVMRADHDVEDAGWKESSYGAPTKYVSERLDAKHAYQRFLAELDAQPFSDQEIAQQIAPIVEEEAAKLALLSRS